MAGDAQEGGRMGHADIRTTMVESSFGKRHIRDPVYPIDKVVQANGSGS